jgi:predicted DCC family thiol-disulfide oxidoreductase YuxK
MSTPDCYTGLSPFFVYVSCESSLIYNVASFPLSEGLKEYVMKPLLVYDGECRFCTWSMNRIQKLDKQDQFAYLPRQAPGIEAQFPKLTDSDFNTGMRLIVTEDELYVGADAIYQIYRRLPPFHLVAWLYHVPILHWVFRAGYALIAKYRHLSGRVTCDTSACDLSFGERNTINEEHNKTA